MEEKEDKQPCNKTPPGQGYTRRVNGKKQLTTTLLQQQLQHTLARLRDLEAQNDMLRMKESMQLVTLDMQELALHALAEAEAEQPSPNTSRSPEPLLSAMLLDVRAHELKRVLQTLQMSAQHATAAGTGLSTRPAGPNEAVQEIMASTFGTPQEKVAVSAAAVAAAAAPTTSESVSNSGDSGSSATSCGTCSTPDEAGSSGCGGRRMHRLMEAITTAEVQEMQEMNLQQVAERIKGHYARMALARHNADRPTPGVTLSELDRAVDDFMQCCAVSLLSNDTRHCLLTGINLETLQHETPPEDLWVEAVLKANLQPQQVEHLTKAFQAYTLQQATLLKEQQALMQQLQGLLGAAHTPDPPAGATCTRKSCAAEGVSNAQSGVAVGPASAPAATAPPYYMSLATGGTVRAVSAQLSETVPAWMFGAAEVAASQAQTQTRSAVLRGKAAAAATGAGGSSSSSSVAAVHAGPAVAQQQQQLLTGLQANDMAKSCSPVEGSSSSTGSWLAPEGMLALDDADNAEKVLQAWQLVCTQMKRQARSLAAVLVNMLTSEQLADSALAAYPFITPAPKFCACLVQMTKNSQNGPRG